MFSGHWTHAHHQGLSRWLSKQQEVVDSMRMCMMLRCTTPPPSITSVCTCCDSFTPNLSRPVNDGQLNLTASTYHNSKCPTTQLVWHGCTCTTAMCSLLTVSRCSHSMPWLVTPVKHCMCKCGHAVLLICR